jgi:hypothetical protein
MNIKKIRSIADSLFDQQKYEDAQFLIQLGIRNYELGIRN